ncbi:MAG: DUF4388 domain-containing protein, partial [Polyangiaceae bacterium]|nr:DUF4388 domain-containing protein [Polyangiaceae bacterium]
VHHQHRSISLYLKDGRLDFASYSGLSEEFLLGRYLIEKGLIEEELLSESIDGSRDKGQVLGDYLVEQGHLESKDIASALERQTSELVYELVRWKSGRFRFVEQMAHPLVERASLGLQTGGLMMEGFRRIDEWRLIEDSFEFEDVLYRDDQVIEQHAEHNQLQELENRVLGLVDGFRTVREVVDDVGSGSFEVCKVIYRLLNARLIKRGG